MSNVVNMPGFVTMREFTEMDDGKRWSTESILNDPLLYRRLVRTQIEELLTLYRHYPLPEFDSVEQILSQLQQAFSDVAPFNHPMLAEFEDPDDDEEAA